MKDSRRFVLLKLTTDRQEASRDVFATAELGLLVLMKLLKTSNMEIVNYCQTRQTLFGYELSSTLLKRRFPKFIAAL